MALLPKSDGQPHGTTESNKHALDKHKGIIGAGTVLNDRGVAKLLVEWPTLRLTSDLNPNRRPPKNGQH